MFLIVEGYDYDYLILIEILNDFYINIVEQTTGMKPSQDSFLKTDSIDEQLDIIIGKYKAHPSIQKIKDNNPFLSHFSLSCATESSQPPPPRILTIECPLGLKQFTIHSNQGCF